MDTSFAFCINFPHVPLRAHTFTHTQKNFPARQPRVHAYLRAGKYHLHALLRRGASLYLSILIQYLMMSDGGQELLLPVSVWFFAAAGLPHRRRRQQASPPHLEEEGGRRTDSSRARAQQRVRHLSLFSLLRFEGREGVSKREAEPREGGRREQGLLFAWRRRMEGQEAGKKAWLVAQQPPHWALLSSCLSLLCFQHALYIYALSMPACLSLLPATCSSSIPAICNMCSMCMSFLMYMCVCMPVFIYTSALAGTLTCSLSHLEVGCHCGLGRPLWALLSCMCNVLSSLSPVLS